MATQLYTGNNGKPTTGTTSGDKHALDVNVVASTESPVSNKISTLNARAASTLAAGAVYQGTGEDVSNYSRIGVAIVSDNATDGTLTIEVSHDNVTWGGPDRTWADTRFAQPHMWNIVEKYFRIKYTNGTTEATNLAIQVQYSVNSDILLGHQLNETLLDETEAIVTRSVLVGKDANEVYRNVGVNQIGALEVSDFLLEVARGKYPTYELNTKYGYNSDIDIGTPEDVWGKGGLYTGQPVHSASAETVTVVSSSANDTSAGTGARTITISGLDANFAEQTETLTMNGTSLVTSANTYKRVYRIRTVTAGSGAVNAGTITCAHTTTTSNIFGSMIIGLNASTIACVTIPASKTAYVKRARISLARANGSAGSALVSMLIRPEGGVYRAIRYETISTSYPMDFTLEGGIELAEKTDIIIRVHSVSDSNSQVSAAFEYLLIDN